MSNITHAIELHRKEYRALEQAKARCYNKNHISYPNYGGRGIIVCDIWKDDFWQFFRDVGSASTRFHSLDRIDNNGNYEPGNVKWSTGTEQQANRRISKHEFKVVSDKERDGFIVRKKLFGNWTFIKRVKTIQEANDLLSNYGVR